VCYKKLGENFNLKTTEMISSEIINLPCHQYMSKKEIAQISKNILSLV
jgi:dTDP-4-amino-4,6-dideoxygalactose transaminase